jgi:hypothetical protein
MRLFLKFVIKKKSMLIIKAIFISEWTDQHSNFDCGFAVTAADARATHILPSADVRHFQ